MSILYKVYAVETSQTFEAVIMVHSKTFLLRAHFTKINVLVRETRVHRKMNCSDERREKRKQVEILCTKLYEEK